jgi:hypothetical protein
MTRIERAEVLNEVVLFDFENSALYARLGEELTNGEIRFASAQGSVHPHFPAAIDTEGQTKDRRLRWKRERRFGAKGKSGSSRMRRPSARADCSER